MEEFMNKIMESVDGCNCPDHRACLKYVLDMGKSEYDKSIKEMIEEEFNEFVGTQSGSIKNFNVYVFKNAILYKLEDDEVGK